MRNLPIAVPDSEIQPFHSLGGVEHICHLRKSCTVLYGIFSEIARMAYHDLDGRLVGTPEVVWKPDGTGLWIDSELRWEDEHPEARPAVYVQLSQLQYQHAIPNVNAMVSRANRFGERSYEHRAAGTVTYMHVAATSGEACALADNTEYVLSSMQGPICSDFCFRTFSLAGRIPLEKAGKESTNRFMSGVAFSYEFVEAWKVKEESPILKSVDFEQPTKFGGATGHNTVERDNIFTASRISGTSST